MKHILFTAFALFASLTAMAQDLKTPTLDDLLSGGRNYKTLVPSMPATAWWGDALISVGDEACTVQFDARPTNKGGRNNRMATNCLFTLEQLNEALNAYAAEHTTLKGEGISRISRPFFPCGESTVVILNADHYRIAYDWEKQALLWASPLPTGLQAHAYCHAAGAEAYVKDDNLFVHRMATSADRKEVTDRLTTDGSRQIVYGQSVHRNEFGIEDGLFWSPKGNALAFYRMDQTMVTDFPLVDIDARVAQPAPEAYPMAGMDIHKVTIGVYHLATGRTVYLETPEVRTDFHEGGEAVYFSNVCWSPDERFIFVQELPRTQDRSELVAYCAETGKRIAVLNTETHERYVEPQHPLTFLPWDATRFIFQSEKDGYNHLYLCQLAADGRSITERRQLTSGEYVDLNLLGFNEKERSVIVVSNESGHCRENVYAVDVRTGRRTLLDNGEGVHWAGALSASGAYYIDRWSKPDMYRQMDLRATTARKPSTEPLNTLFAHPESPWKDYSMPTVETGTLTAADGKTPLHYRLVLPVGFDKTKKYPTVVYVYGGPHAVNVKETWSYLMRNWEAHMANRGYVLFVLDNRGSGDRGFEFESCTHRHLGDIEMEDQMQGVAFLKSLPYVDADRLGVHGWSFGGFMTTNLMCSYPDVFKVGVAGGPVIDWRYYEAMYGERYMDAPQDNPKGYESTSLVNKAKNLKGRLQIIVGYNDPTCVLQHNLAFLRACEDAGTQPDYFVYPGQGHNMMGSDMIHLHERITRYFDDFLK